MGRGGSTGKKIFFLYHPFEFLVETLLFYFWLSDISEKFLSMHTYVTTSFLLFEFSVYNEKLLKRTV